MYEPKKVGAGDGNTVIGCQWCEVKDQRITQLESQLAEAREAMTKTVENCEGCGGEGSWYEAGHYVSCPECSLLRDALAGQGGEG